MWNQLLKPLYDYRPASSVMTAGLPEAAVLMPITGDSEPQLLLTLRASGLSTHGGQVSFPGGHRDPEDADLAATALRETWEEIGINRYQVELVGQLSTLVSLHGLAVTPFVGRIIGSPQLTPNADEIAAVFNVPLAFFRDQPPECVHRLTYQKGYWYVPSYRYQRHQIWGLSAMMIVELLNVLFGAGIDMQQEPKQFVVPQR